MIVVFAIIIDRMSATLATERKSYDGRVALAILGAAAVVAILAWAALPDPATFRFFDGAADTVDRALGRFTARNGASLDAIKNGAMFYGLLPLRIGLDEAVLPFTWGYSWTQAMSLILFAAAGVIETGISHLPWLFVLTGAGALGWVAGGRRLATFAVLMLGAVLVSGLWDRALLSLYLSGAAVFACAVLGGALGLLSAASSLAWRIIRPACDMLQTIPLFVFLIPVLMFFQIGEFSAFLAIIAYAIVPMIRYTRHGLITTPPEMIEAAVSSGGTNWQIMRDIRAPYAAPTILSGA